ncbi:MAG TPA: ATP-dependent DNA helicase [Candidatus Methylomirabilis sp.]|nr:ATP-dependent DNA helicase [Candidatus Methylomirabilis sp.]
MSVILDGLNDAQRRAVTHGHGPLLIVAGAGTGKTTVLTRRYVHLMQSERLTTENVLAVTFTEKAAGEMEDRILQILPNGTYDFWISTFHGLCQRLLEKYALEIGLPTRFRLLTETDGWLLLKRHIDELPLDHYRPLGNPVKFLAELLKHFSRAKDEGVTPETYLRFADESAMDGDTEYVSGERARLKELANCYFAYQKILRDEGALDFGDLIVETLRLLRERPHVLKDLREQFRYILVDEFQDTNWAQYELIKLLAGEVKNLTVVGDDDQSIYKFRGASLANILQFKDDFADAATVTLTENYRSNQEILDAAYTSITKNNPNRLEVRLADQGLVKKLSASRGAGGAIDLRWYKTLEDEAEGVAKRIRELKSEDASLRWSDIAVLSRSNDGAEPFIRALDRHGIPFRFYALRGLYSKPAVVDIVALFSLCDGHRESSAVWRVMASPCYRFGARDLAAFIGYASRKTGNALWAAVEQYRLIPALSDDAKRASELLVTHVLNLSESAKRDTPLRMLQHALDKTGYLNAIMKLPEQEKIDAINVLNAFAERIRRYEQSTHAPSLKGFMEEFRLEIDSGEEGALNLDPNEGPELVKVLTVHASKGLEFRHVFIVSLVDQRFPTRPRSDAIPLPDGLVNERLPEGNTHLEEERRLFYVAVTRARDSVTLTGGEHYGGTRKKKPSVFLGEMGLDVSGLQARADSELLSLLPPSTVTDAELLEEREVFPLKRRFSFTQLAAFEKCPLQYKFAHVYKIPILGSHQKSFGNCIHLTFQDVWVMHQERGKAKQGDLFLFAGAGSDASDENASLSSTQEGSAIANHPDGESPVPFRVSLDEAFDAYERRWAENDDWYEKRSTYEEYHTKGREAVKRMMEEWILSSPDVAFLEKPFDWRLGQHSLKGKIDRMDRRSDGTYVVVDYKTGTPKTTDTIKTDDKKQLWIYQLAMEEMGLAITGLRYVYVLTGDTTDVEILQGKERDEFRQEVEERMDEILLSKFHPSPSPWTCSYCDFKEICEYRKL